MRQRQDTPNSLKRADRKQTKQAGVGGGGGGGVGGAVGGGGGVLVK